jgi:thioredoxin-related protein
MRPTPQAMLAAVLTTALVALVATSSARVSPKWVGWDEGMKEAQRSGRPVLVDVYTGWCGYCKRMDSEVYSQPAVSEYLAKRFVTVKLDAESGERVTYAGRNYASRNLAAAFHVEGYPTTMFFSAKGEHLFDAPGYFPAERFALLLRYVGDGHFARNEDLNAFVEKSLGEAAKP